MVAGDLPLPRLVAVTIDPAAAPDLAALRDEVAPGLGFALTGLVRWLPTWRLVRRDRAAEPLLVAESVPRRAYLLLVSAIWLQRLMAGANTVEIITAGIQPPFAINLRMALPEAAALLLVNLTGLLAATVRYAHWATFVLAAAFGWNLHHRISERVDWAARGHEARQLVLAEARQRGLIMTTAGAYAQCLRSLVPLVISDEMLDEGLDIFDAATEAAVKAQ